MKRFNNMIFIFSSIISTLFLLTACSKQEIQFQETETYSTLESVTEQVEDIETRPEVSEEQEMEDSVNQLEVYHPIDYEELEKNHVIFKENICEEPHSVYDNSYLCEQLSAEIEMTEKAITEYGYPGGAELDYFTFDFNDDGEEEYVVSFNGAGWNGSSGNLVEIYEKADNGNLKEIYTVIAEVYSHNGEYWPIAILEEKTNGYYDFVLPWSNNRIWKYNAETDQYCSLDIYEQYIINRQGIGSQVMTESPIEEEIAETLKISINDWGNISKEKEGEYYTLTSGLFYDGPKKFLWKEEGLLKAYTEKMFLELCCAPKKIEYCYDKISQCGVEKFKQIEWACDNSRINFNDAETEWGEVLEEIKIAGRTKVVSHYIYGNEKRAEDNWQIIFSWIYNTDTGIFDITDIIMEKADVERAQINILVPQKNMSEKEIALFTEFLFLYCCQYPELIEENNKVFDTESIDRLKMVDWYYEEPEKVYDWAESSGSWAENTYKGRTQIDSQYTFNDIDFGQFQKRNNIQNPDYYSELEERYSSPAFCWRVSVSWVYNKESGIVSVDDIKLLPTLAY